MISLQIDGVVETIFFRNEDNGYTVARFTTEEDEITIVGHAMMIHERQPLSLEGEWVFHSKYGEQFQFHQIKPFEFTEESAMVAYLSSGLIPNIGQKIARDIVEKFGKDTFEIMEKSPHRLYEISGLGKKRVAAITQAFEDQRDLRETLLFTESLDISPKLGIKIFKRYGNLAEDVIRQNPYQLADDIVGIGFKRADEIAKKLGFESDSKFRKLSGMKYVLREGVAEGHSYLPVEKLLDRSAQILGLSQESLEEVLIDLSIDPNFYLTGLGEGGNAYLASFYRAEKHIAGGLVEKAQMPVPAGIHDEVFKEIEEKMDFKLSAMQQKAVEESLNHGILVVTGGPGTGKTTTLKAIVHAMESIGLKVVLTAPTGRAAKRMEEATSREAKTIHRLLQFEYQPEEGLDPYSREIEEEVDADVIIVDEASMVDLILFNDLLKGIKKEARLILLGDVDQLPSVGAGNVLQDIIQSEVVPVINLNEVFRQAETSMIVQNAHRINRGEHPLVNCRDRDFYLIRTSNPLEAQKIICDLISKRLPDHYGYDPMEDIQILSPMKKGPCGTEALNEVLQASLNPEGKEIKYGDYIYRVGDKVMQIKNDYDLEWKMDSTIYQREGKGVFNGDMGKIVSITEEGDLQVLYEDLRKVTYDTSNLDLIMPAYACTIHKSQGSEFPVVVIPVTGGPPMLMTRNLIYTGITRAQRLVVLVGQDRILNQMVDNNRIDLRYSSLDQALKSQWSVFYE